MSRDTQVLVKYNLQASLPNYCSMSLKLCKTVYTVYIRVISTMMNVGGNSRCNLSDMCSAMHI